MRSPAGRFDHWRTAPFTGLDGPYPPQSIKQHVRAGAGADGKTLQERSTMLKLDKHQLGPPFHFYFLFFYFLVAPVAVTAVLALFPLDRGDPFFSSRFLLSSRFGNMHALRRGALFRISGLFAVSAKDRNRCLQTSAPAAACLCWWWWWWWWWYEWFLFR